MLSLATKIGYLSIIGLSGFPNTAKSGDAVSGVVGVGNPLQYSSMWVQTVVDMIVAGTPTRIFDYYGEIPPKIQHNYVVSFTMPNKDVKLQAQNFWMEPETGDLLADAMATFNIKLVTEDGEKPPSEDVWKYAAIGGGVIAVIAVVLAVSRK